MPESKGDRFYSISVLRLGAKACSVGFFMQAAVISSPSDLRQRWHQVLAAHGSSVQLWRKFIQWQLGDFSAFSLPAVRQAYGDSIEVSLKCSALTLSNSHWQTCGDSIEVDLKCSALTQLNPHWQTYVDRIEVTIECSALTQSSSHWQLGKFDPAEAYAGFMCIGFNRAAVPHKVSGAQSHSGRLHGWGWQGSGAWRPHHVLDVVIEVLLCRDCSPAVSSLLPRLLCCRWLMSGVHEKECVAVDFVMQALLTE